MNRPKPPHALVVRFATVVLDVDSTLSGIEGIDWLAALRGGDTAAMVRRLTDDAMSGRLSLEQAYALRLARIAPTRDEVGALADAYRAAVAPGAGPVSKRLRDSGVRVIAISGGLRDAVLPLCRDTGFAANDVFAVGMTWDEQGRYVAFDRASPLVTQHGKAVLLRELAPQGPILAVGDGSTDAAMRAPGAADAFAAYVGFVRREPVVAAANHVVASFDDLLTLVLSVHA